MPKYIGLIVLIGSLVIVTAQPASAATSPRAGMSCQDFMSYDEVTRPKVIYWAEGVDHKGRPQDAVVDLGETERLIPIVTEECQMAPKASFWSKLEASWMRAKADLRRHL